MDLKDFVQSSIIQIIQGIEGANEALKDSQAVISPRCYKNAAGCYSEAHKGDALIDAFLFDVAIMVDSKTEAEGKGGIKVMGFIDAGGGASHEIKNSSVSHLKFSVPVLLPPYEPKTTKQPAVQVPAYSRDAQKGLF